MLPKPAQYLLRIDDLCPTMAAGRWPALASLIGEFRLRPILAVVPENRDPDLCRQNPDPHFWQKMRALQEQGATIALHGYTHLCASRGRSLIRLSRSSEFAGVCGGVQRNWIRRGVDRLRAEGLPPVAWVAPRHGFDRETIVALREEGIHVISDGFARRPFVREGMFWIPQQLWTPAERRRGVWTICIHANTATDEDTGQLRAFVRTHAERFTCVEEILEEWEHTPLTLTERMHEGWTLQRQRARQLRKRMCLPAGESFRQ
ncbi:MAG: DUF2334 domain-containing protein [Acidobacteriota bacterium]